MKSLRPTNSVVVETQLHSFWRGDDENSPIGKTSSSPQGAKAKIRPAQGRGGRAIIFAQPHPSSSHHHKKGPPGVTARGPTKENRTADGAVHMYRSTRSRWAL